MDRGEAAQPLRRRAVRGTVPPTVRTEHTAAMRISDEQRRWRLARRHRLAPSHREPDDVATTVEDLVAIHSSDPATVFLALGARMDRPSIPAIEDALYTDRTAIRHHAMRRTLWVMTPRVAEWAHAACTRKIAAAERRRTIRLLDRDEAWLDDAIDAITDLLVREGPLTAREIGLRLPELAERITLAAGTSSEVTTSGHSRALVQAGFEGKVLRARPAGSWVASQYAWVVPDRWVSVDWDRHDSPGAATELSRAWLARFGPATFDDLVWWTGWTRTMARRALDAVGACEVQLDDGAGFALADDVDHGGDPGPWVALLPGLDPTAMGWKQRTWYLDADIARRIVDRSGNIGPTVWIDGRIAGGWAQRPDGSLAIELADTPSADHRRLLAEEVDRLTSFVGEDRFRVRFPSPNQNDLFASGTSDDKP